VLGLPSDFAVDLAAAETAFRDLSRRFHPDRFATADPRARRASLQRSVQLNEAWRTIKDPVRRAEYLLHLQGYQVGAEQGASAPATSEGGERRRIPVPAELLGEVLELREELAEARAVGDEEREQVMATQVRARADAALAHAAEAIASAAKASAAGERDDLFTTATRDLMAIRYFHRFLEEVARQDERKADGALEAPRGG
jgi:molecular chaperone HscB